MAAVVELSKLKLRKWDSLTLQAQAALRDEAERLLARAPNQGVVPMIRTAMEKNPASIPAFIESFKERRGPP